MSQQTRTQLAVGFFILFTCEIFILGLMPSNIINPHTTVEQTGDMSFMGNVINNIEGLGWWNTLIFAPFVAFAVIFIVGLIPTVNVGE